MSTKTELNTDNPEYFTCQYEQLQIAILGGLKIEGLDRMRVTLKILFKKEGVEGQRTTFYLNDNVFPNPF
ncbi:hypothetical protein [Paraflavitalea speifideaquila]|uniref:hypothetical protein n=1 Tax=Paraflavitalea speifideaquila TaxID=3076558 RepID=UPI0028EAF607|nr:hypothetical protein [Paraflavitalea speifideiaquila]